MTVAGLPCAWWLVPEAGRHERLSRWIGALAALHGGPVFEPHLTLALSTLPEGADVPAVRARLAAAVAVPGRAGEARDRHRPPSAGCGVSPSQTPGKAAAAVMPAGSPMSRKRPWGK